MNGVGNLKDNIGLLKFPKTGKLFSVGALVLFFEAFLLVLCRFLMRLFRHGVPPDEDWCLFVTYLLNRNTSRGGAAKTQENSGKVVNLGLQGKPRYERVLRNALNR